jgi:hypothetical protein
MLLPEIKPHTCHGFWSFGVRKGERTGQGRLYHIATIGLSKNEKTDTNLKKGVTLNG